MCYEDIIRNYGVTDTKPVLKKYREADAGFERVATAQIRILQARMKREARVRKAETFLEKHPKKA